MSEGERPLALVLSGGVALGAYHAGVYEALSATRGPDWIAGSSIGAVTAALIAGSPPEKRLENLRQFWHPDFARALTGVPSWDHLTNWTCAIAARLAGVPGHFRPRLTSPIGPFVSFYDLTPMRKRLEAMIDFERLNSGEVRISIGTTDIETGDQIIFDTAKGARIGPEHLLASCGLPPEFAPVEIEGRRLGDGGLSGNVPLEAVLEEPASRDCIVADLYPRKGARPATMEDAFARRSDLLFGNQTWQRLRAHRREAALRRHAQVPFDMPRIAYLAYRPTEEEAGPERIFDYSPRSLAQRWKAGKADAALALERLATIPSGGVIGSDGTWGEQ